MLLEVLQKSKPTHQLQILWREADNADFQPVLRLLEEVAQLGGSPLNLIQLVVQPAIVENCAICFLPSAEMAKRSSDNLFFCEVGCVLPFT